MTLPAGALLGSFPIVELDRLLVLEPLRVVDAT